MFLNETSFQQTIERIVKEKRIDYLDAILLFCEDNDLDPTDIKKLVNDNLRDKIKLSAIDQGLMQPISQLPI